MAPVPGRQENMTVRDEDASVVINAADRHLQHNHFIAPWMSSQIQQEGSPPPNPTAHDSLSHGDWPPLFTDDDELVIITDDGQAQRITLNESSHDEDELKYETFLAPKTQCEFPPPQKQEELPCPKEQDGLPSPIKDETLPLQTNQRNSEDDNDFVKLFSLLCSQKGTDLLSEVALKLYVDHSNNSFGAKEQEGLTCYANALAAVLHLAMKRIVGRDGGYPDFCTIREELIQQYGRNGVSEFEQVLEEVCPRYRLHYRQVNTQGALSAVAEKRPVIANFYLTTEEWRAFAVFFKDNPTGTLSEKEIDIKNRKPDVELEGHSVVLTSFNSGSLRLMNSWGPGWGDEGFFNVESTDVLGFEYWDIFWTLDDLSAEEKAKFEKQKRKLKNMLANGQRQPPYFRRRSPPSPRKR